MKKFEHKNKDERRRVLLSKNNELSYTFDNEKLPEGGKAVRTNDVGVMVKLRNMNKRVLAVVLALVFVLAVVPTTIYVGIRGKADDDNSTPRLEFGNNNRLVVGSDGLPAGSYLKDIDGKDYTYNLEIDYTNGDVLVFDPETRKITADHDPATNNKLKPITDYIDSNQIDPSGDTIEISLEGADKLDPDIPYSYAIGDNYYVFSFSDEVIGWIAGENYDASNSDPTTRTHSLAEQNDKVVISINKESGAVSYSSDSSGYDRRTIYVETDQFDPNNDGIYLITLFDADDNEYLLAYGTEDNGTKKLAYSDNRSSAGIYHNDHSVNRTIFTPTAFEVAPIDGADTSDYYVSNNDASLLSFNEGQHIIDGLDYSLREAMLEGTTSVLPEFLAVKDSTDSSHWYLKGYDLETDKYSDLKSLGSLYNKKHGLDSDYNEDLFNSILLYNKLDESHLFKTSTSNSGGSLDGTYVPVSFKNGLLWKYDDEKLVNDKYELNSINSNAQYLGLVFPDPNTDETNIYINRSSTGTTNKIYKMQDVYTKSDLPNLNGYLDKVELGKEYSPSIISYTNSSQTVEGLKTKKTVTETENRDVFHVKLEGYMTSRTLKLPTTDIVLALDTSGRMDDTLYNREYRNLNTQTIFKEVSLSSVPHDSLYDGQNPNNGSQLTIQSWIPRGYTDNKYVEDPNSPGTYVYLAQEYKYKIQSNLKDNHYKYYFTSSDGSVYETPWIDAYVLASIGSWNGVDSLTFKRKGTEGESGSVKSVTITSFYARDGEHKDAALTDSNTSLYNYSISSGGLWYKHADGNYYRVTVEPLNSVTVNGTQQYLKYKYSVTIPNDKTYTVTYGNNAYGAKNSVFQGFKKYKTENGKLIVDLENSLPSKSLYTYTGTNASGVGNTSVTRLDAMKEAIEDLLIHINLDARASGVEERVAVTTFSNSTAEKIPYHLGDVDMSDTRAVDNMISDIYGYTSTSTFFGLTKTKKARIDVGTSAANTEFRNNSPDGNKRYEIVFTAGVPTKSNDGSLDLSVANSAIANTDTAKTKYGANVYAVGMFDYADETHMHGDYFYYSTSSHPWINCNGTVGSIWGKSLGYQIWGGSDIDPVDADVTNRMLNLMSSNFASANLIGLNTSNFYNPGHYTWTTGGYGYKITRNFTRTDNKFYYGIAPTQVISVDPNTNTITEKSLSAEELNERFRTVFDQIESSISAPLSTLDTGTVLFDGISDYYDLVDENGNPGEITDIKYYASEINDNTGTVKQVSDPLNIEVTRDSNNKIKAIEVSGFDYSEHYSGAGANAAKMVVEFDIKRADNFIGGNRVPTNTANSSIIDRNGKLEERFNIPAIDLYIIKDDDVAKDQSVHYSCEADLTNAFKLADVNGFNNAYVNLIYDIYEVDAQGKPTSNKVNTYTVFHGDTVGHWDDNEQADLEKMFPQVFEDKKFAVQCTVQPYLDGTIEDEFHPENNLPIANVYVLKPHLTATDLRITEAGDMNIDELVSNNVEWKHDSSGDPDSSISIPNPASDAPSLEYKLKDVTAGHSGTIYNPFARDAQDNIIDLPAVSITDDTDYQIIDLQVAARTLNYEVLRWIEERIEIEDENGQGTGEYEENAYWGIVEESKVRTAESLTFEGNSPTAYYVNDEDLNSDKGVYQNNDQIPNGKYSILLSKPFTVKVQKVFDGGYANPEAVAFTVTEGNDGNGTVVATQTFNANDFTRQGAVFESSEVTLTANAGTSFECGETYTLTETIINTDHTDRYTIAIAGTDKNDEAVEDSVSGDAAFTFSTETMNDEISIVVTNTQIDPVITGRTGNDSKLNPFFIAAAVIALLGGSGTAYAVKRKKETEA